MNQGLPHDKAFEALKAEALSNAIDLTHDALMEPGVDSTPIDVETYEEYDFTDTEMLDWILNLANRDMHMTYLVCYKGKFAYTDKGQAVADEELESLTWQDTPRGAIQAEMKKDSEDAS